MELSSITTEDLLPFLTEITRGTKPTTKHLRFTLISTFLNFVTQSINSDFENPCKNPSLRKLFKAKKLGQHKILEKDVVDEIIFKIKNERNRLLLELMARGCMRIGDLKLTPRDIEDRKAIIRDPKSGREVEAAFLPRKVAERLNKYVFETGIDPDDRIFPIKYGAARIIVKKAGDLIGVDVRPHDLRRFAATYASRAGTPVEIVSKILLRHSNLSVTERYLGEVSDSEAMRWIDNLHA